MRYPYQGKMHDFKAESELPEAFDQVMRFRPGCNVRNAAALNAPPNSLANRRFRR
jgi:hypothetical protein